MKNGTSKIAKKYAILPLRKLRLNLPFYQMRMFIALILVVGLLFTKIIPNFSFIRVSNLNNLLTDPVIPAIFAFGMGIVFAGSGFDLSLDHIASMSALTLCHYTWPP